MFPHEDNGMMWWIHSKEPDDKIMHKFDRVIVMDLELFAGVLMKNCFGVTDGLITNVQNCDSFIDNCKKVY